jgi:hypothetical protein
MPDPWLEGEDLQKHEEEVANHPLTQEAQALKDQEDELQKLHEERQEQAANEVSGLPVDVDTSSIHPAEDTGYSENVASGGQGTSGEATAPEPAGNVDSDLPTQKELSDQDEEAPKKRAAAKKSDSK